MSAQIIDLTARLAPRRHAEPTVTKVLETVALRKKLRDDIYSALHGWIFAGDSGAVMQMQNHLRVRYNVNNVDEIPAEKLEEAIAIVHTMSKAAFEFLLAMNDAKHAFSRKVFGGGEPWTPWIRRTLKRPLGDAPDWRGLAAEIEQRNL
jgi:hypothetical protein